MRKGLQQSQWPLVTAELSLLLSEYDQINLTTESTHVGLLNTYSIALLLCAEAEFRMTKRLNA